MNFREIAETAQKSGYDMITVEAMGGKTLVTCTRRLGRHEPWEEEIDESFEAVEDRALVELSAVAGWDVRRTSVRIRAFGMQDNSRIDEMARNPNGKRTQHFGSVATEFAPVGWRNPDFQKFQDEPPRRRSWTDHY